MVPLLPFVDPEGLGIRAAIIVLGLPQSIPCTGVERFLGPIRLCAEDVGIPNQKCSRIGIAELLTAMQGESLLREAAGVPQRKVILGGTRIFANTGAGVVKGNMMDLRGENTCQTVPEFSAQKKPQATRKKTSKTKSKKATPAAADAPIGDEGALNMQGLTTAETQTNTATTPMDSKHVDDLAIDNTAKTQVQYLH
ncbi:hypothetical protein B0H14DRAFT_2608975 [Mycena olivaceomarginata]|nr:hypothetical protein B0H14DRAFT_2608975 [Mycena olivaceomarginata]